MPDNLLMPSVDLHIGSLEEYNRHQKEKTAAQHRIIADYVVTA